MRILILLFGLALLLLVPLLIALVYKAFYNRHINSGSERRWPSPFAVAVGGCCVQAVILCAIALLANLLYARDTGVSIRSETMIEAFTQENCSSPAYSAYQRFDGQEVDGYTRESGRQGAFTYCVYRRTDADESGADYVVIARYDGDAAYNMASVEEVVNSRSGGAASAISLEKSQTYYAVIGGEPAFFDEAGNAVKAGYDWTYRLALYETDVSDAGCAIDSEDPVAELRISLAHVKG